MDCRLNLFKSNYEYLDQNLKKMFSVFSSIHRVEVNASFNMYVS